MGSRLIRKHCKLNSEGVYLMEGAIDRLGFSARAFNRVLEITRTIADLDGKADIDPDHIFEAIPYRTLDRSNRAS